MFKKLSIKILQEKKRVNMCQNVVFLLIYCYSDGKAVH